MYTAFSKKGQCFLPVKNISNPWELHFEICQGLVVSLKIFCKTLMRSKLFSRAKVSKIFIEQVSQVREIFSNLPHITHQFQWLLWATYFFTPEKVEFVVAACLIHVIQFLCYYICYLLMKFCQLKWEEKSRSVIERKNRKHRWRPLGDLERTALPYWFLNSYEK